MPSGEEEAQLVVTKGHHNWKRLARMTHASKKISHFEGLVVPANDQLNSGDKRGKCEDNNDTEQNQAKKFCPNTNSNDKVEEASLEWPRPAQ